ncbi:MAG: flippase-like domain-containing protein, partial [Anaerolineae bacterium]|nr:flippase-like domain-containing protein [Anaerolineae bacterium]
TLVLSLVLSLGFYALAILNVYFSSLTFYQPINLLDIAIIVPIIMVVSMLPLTFNGIGVQEWAYVLLFGWIGVPEAIGLSAILLIRVNTMIAALIGGAVYPQIRLRNQNANVESGNLPTMNATK